MDLDAKSRAAIAGWDAAANAESEAEAAEARGLQAGIKRGRADAEKKARKNKLMFFRTRFLRHGCQEEYRSSLHFLRNIPSCGPQSEILDELPQCKGNSPRPIPSAASSRSEFLTCPCPPLVTPGTSSSGRAF